MTTRHARRKGRAQARKDLLSGDYDAIIRRVTEYHPTKRKAYMAEIVRFARAKLGNKKSIKVVKKPLDNSTKEFTL